MPTQISTPQINNYLKSYLEIDLGRIKINCPYWKNKLKGGKVVVRGQFNGKGESADICKSLKKAIQNLPPNISITKQNIFKLAKRERIGIDCSGLVYRTWDHLIHLQQSKQVNSLDNIFSGGINKTNVRRLTSGTKTIPINKVSQIIPGDVIRFMGGKHALLVVENNGQYIEYVHSSNRSALISGVHKGKIQILKANKDLDQQNWLEQTPTGDSYGQKYFQPQVGDGAKRLKYFQYGNR